MWAAARPILLLAPLLLFVSPARAARTSEEGAASATLDVDLDTAAEAEVAVGAASGSGLQAGTVMLDRYELLSLLGAEGWPVAGVKGYSKVGYLGKGAFGETWLARNTGTQEQVAIKFFYRPGYNGAVTLLNMRIANYQEQAQLREAGAECDTPKNIVKGKSTAAGADRFALCLENKVSDPQYAHLVLQVAGTEDLEQWVQKNRRSLKSDVVKRLAKMMLEGLVQMEGNYVHRDIKPANLMVYEEGGQVYLRFIDFGLVVREGAMDGVAGTPMFMPPELWPVVPRSPRFTYTFDVYSTGETLYWLICGTTFHEKIFNRFGGRGETEIKRALVSNDPKGMCSPPSALADVYSLVVDYMLKASPSGRKRASELLSSPVFQGVDTSKPSAAVEQRPKPQQPPKPISKPQVIPPKQPPVVEQQAPQAPTFLEKCHDDKRFWFANVGQCCLREKYDPKRDAVCNRPCGPKVAYTNGQCADQCQATSAGQFEFSKTKFCCVAKVWKDKCIYPDYLPSGEGWRWMKQEKL